MKILHYRNFLLPTLQPFTKAEKSPLDHPLEPLYRVKGLGVNPSPTLQTLHLCQQRQIMGMSISKMMKMSLKTISIPPPCSFRGCAIDNRNKMRMDSYDIFTSVCLSIACGDKLF